MMNILRGTAIAIVSVILLSGCSMAYKNSNVEPIVSSDVADSKAALNSLQWAKEITIQKHVISLNDRYDVEADGVKIGTIQGQYIYGLGDTQSLFTEKGNLVSSEGEGFHFVTHGAALFDYENKPAGELGENFTVLLKNWNFLDAEGVKVGSAQQNINLTLAFTITNKAGEKEYTITKDLLSIGARLKIKRLSNEPTVSAMDVVWLSTISNEIQEAEQAEDDSDN